MKGSSVVNWLNSAQVKILLVQLSDFPDKSYQEYLKKLDCIKRVDLSELPSYESDDIILKKLGQSGSINYNFIQTIDSTSNDFIDFQLHQRIFGILGLIHEPSNKRSKEEIEKITKEIKEKFSYEIESDYIFFESSELKNDDGFAKEIQCLTVKIVSRMSELLNEINQRPSIPSPCGIEDYSGTASRSSSSSKAKMRLSGRIQKLQADLNLLTGAFSEAVAGYVSASEDARISNDSIWSAASQEGFNTALCLQNEQLLTDDKTDIYKSLIDKLIPLAIIYERSGTPILSIELQITCSKIHRFISQGSAALSALGEAWKSCNLLAFDDKIIAYNRVLKELASSGNWRKWSLYMVQMAQTLKIAQKPEIALMTLSKTLHVYNLTQSKEYQMIKGWPIVQSALLKEMVKLSETHSNRLLYFLYGWMYLVHSNRCNDTSDQVQIIENLRKKSMRDMFSLSSQSEGNSGFICSLPIFVKLNLVIGNKGGLFVSEKDTNMSIPGPFIYNPNSTKMSTSTSNSSLRSDESLITNESSTFKLVLSNPFVFPIVLRNIYLITDDVSDDSRLSEQVSTTLPPMTKDRNILINLIPKRSGQLKILGFCATFMNVEIQFLINSKGKILEESRNFEDFGIKFDVIEPQPFLQCTCDAITNGLQLYEGEMIEASLIFKDLNNNPNSLKISNINFKIFEEQQFTQNPEYEINEIIFLNDDLESPFKIESESFQQLLPIEEKSFEIALKIYGTRNSNNTNGFIKNANLEIFYSCSNTKDKIYWRRLNFPLSITICPIVKVEQFSFHKYTRISSNNSDSSSDSNSVLVKFNHIDCDEDDLCVGSFIIYNLESCFSLNISIEIPKLSFKFNEEISTESGKRIFFFIPRLPKSSTKKEPKKLPLSEKKIAAVRKLRRPDTDEFLDDSFEDFLYDPDQFWIKKYLIDNLILKWFDGQGRQGNIALSQCHIPAVYQDAIFKDHLTVSVDCDEFRNIKVGQEIIVNFKISPEEKGKKFELKLFPVVLLTETEIGLNFDRVLLYQGCLDSFVSFGSSDESQYRTFKFYPISTATVKIIYQLIEIETRQVFWCIKPILIETNSIK